MSLKKDHISNHLKSYLNTAQTSPIHYAISPLLLHLATKAVALTIAINGKGSPGGCDLVVADLAVLRGAVLVCGLHLQDAVVDFALSHCRPVLVLPEHRRKLIHVVDLDVYHRPAKARQVDGVDRISYFILRQTRAIHRWSEWPERISASS